MPMQRAPCAKRLASKFDGFAAVMDVVRRGTMQRSDFRCLHRLRVRWAEVDIQKVVFNAHYLAYVDIALMDYWRALALPYTDSMAVLGGEMLVKKATLEYHASARLDDVLDIGLRCERVGTSSVRFGAAIFRGQTLLTSWELVYVFADVASQSARPVPPALRAMLESFESGGALAEVRTGSWHALRQDATALRTRVFVQEQGIDAAIELDALDATAVHAVLYNRMGMPIATGRLLQPAPGIGRIGRMAVERTLRGAGWGRQLLGTVVQAARERGDTEVQLHAQRSAEGFYAAAGFAVRGEPYEEAGIPHITMVRFL